MLFPEPSMNPYKYNHLCIIPWTEKSRTADCRYGIFIMYDNRNAHKAYFSIVFSLYGISYISQYTPLPA